MTSQIRWSACSLHRSLLGYLDVLQLTALLLILQIYEYEPEPYGVQPAVLKT